VENSENANSHLPGREIICSQRLSISRGCERLRLQLGLDGIQNGLLLGLFEMAQVLRGASREFDLEHGVHSLPIAAKMPARSACGVRNHSRGVTPFASRSGSSALLGCRASAPNSAFINVGGLS